MNESSAHTYGWNITQTTVLVLIGRSLRKEIISNRHLIEMSREMSQLGQHPPWEIEFRKLKKINKERKNVHSARSPDG